MVDKQLDLNKDPVLNLCLYFQVSQKRKRIKRCKIINLELCVNIYIFL